MIVKAGLLTPPPGGGTIPLQFSVPNLYVNSEFPDATVTPPTVQLTVTNDSLVVQVVRSNHHV